MDSNVIHVDFRRGKILAAPAAPPILPKPTRDLSTTIFLWGTALSFILFFMVAGVGGKISGSQHFSLLVGWISVGTFCATLLLMWIVSSLNKSKLSHFPYGGIGTLGRRPLGGKLKQ